MQIHQLKKRTLNKKKLAVGRGGRRGKTSGRGHKGQKARAGRKIRPEIRDMIKKIPKRRGYGKNRARTVNSSRIKPKVLNLALLESEFKTGEVVSIKTLLEKGLVKKQKGRNPQVKILGKGDLKKKLTIKSLLISKKAEEKIIKGGSKIEK